MISEIFPYIHLGFTSYLFLKLRQQNLLIDDIEYSILNLKSKYKNDKKSTHPLVSNNMIRQDYRSSVKYSIEHIDLTMDELGWDTLKKNISKERGVYLHFGVTPEGYVPLRIGMTAASQGFHSRWLGEHKKAFNAIRENNYRYIEKYPNYAFFFDDIRNIFPKTILVFIKLRYDRNQILDVENHLIKQFNPMWEFLYVKSKWLVWKDDVYNNESIHNFLDKIYIKPFKQNFVKNSTKNLIEKIKEEMEKIYVSN